MSGYGRIYATIDLDAVSYNLDSIQKKISSGTDIIAVVKADGYGHGALEISRMLEREPRVFGFAVASAEEAFALRDFGIQKPVLILGYTFAEDYEALVLQNIRPTVYSYEMAQAYDAAALKAGTKALLHIKVDTGMGRIGYPVTREAADEIAEIAALPGIEIEGLFTHFARADERDQTAGSVSGNAHPLRGQTRVRFVQTLFQQRSHCGIFGSRFGSCARRDYFIRAVAFGRIQPGCDLSSSCDGIKEYGDTYQDAGSGQLYQLWRHIPPDGAKKDRHHTGRVCRRLSQKPFKQRLRADSREKSADSRQNLYGSVYGGHTGYSGGKSFRYGDFAGRR